MASPYDALQTAQAGQMIEALARQFQLSQEQARAAVEALLPAFALGLKRQAADPSVSPAMFGMMGGPGTSPFNNPAPAFPTADFGMHGLQRGDEVLGAIFGSKDVSRAVADHAAALSGVGPAVLRAMLPVLASMLLGGAPRADAAPAPAPAAWQEMMGQMMGGLFGRPPARPQAAPQRAPHPAMSNPIMPGGLFGAMLGSMMQGMGTPAPTPPPDPKPEAPARASDVFGQMADAGRRMQQAHVDALEQIFTSFGPKKPS